MLPGFFGEWRTTGMLANIGSKLVDIGPGTLVLEGNFTTESHGFPTSRGPILHGGAIATLADETLASVAFTYWLFVAPSRAKRERQREARELQDPRDR